MALAILRRLCRHRTITRIEVSMHRLRPGSIDERMNECEAEQQEQNNPADPRERHEGTEDTAWRIPLARTQVTPIRLYAFFITSASGYDSFKR